MSFKCEVDNIMWYNIDEGSLIFTFHSLISVSLHQLMRVLVLGPINTNVGFKKPF